MRSILTILLSFFITFASAQFGAGMAQYSAECQPKFGVLVNSSTLSNSAKAHISKDTLGCQWARGAITIQTWNGTSNRFETFDGLGLKQVININYSAGTGTAFVTAAQLAGYVDTLTLILNKYPQIYAIAIENEEQNETYYTGPLSDYVNQVIASYAVAHTRGIKICDGGMIAGGLDIKTYRYVQSVYGQAAADQYGAACMTTAQINAAKTVNSNPTLEAKAKEIDTILTLVNYVDWFNIHGYEVFSATNTQKDTVTQISQNVFRYQKEFIEGTTKRPCISNEIGVRDNSQPTLITNMYANFYRLGFFVAVHFDGAGGVLGDDPLTDDVTGAILPTGTAYKAYITTHQNGGTALP